MENTSVSGARAGGEGGRGVKVEVRREDEPAGFEDLIMMVLRSEGPPVSYARIEAPTAITLTVPPAPGKGISHHTHTTLHSHCLTFTKLLKYSQTYNGTK